MDAPAFITGCSDLDVGRSQVTAELLKWSTLVIVLAFGQFHLVRQKNPLPSGSQGWTLLDLIHLIFVLTAAVLAIIKGCVTLSDQVSWTYLERRVIWEASSAFASATALVILALFSWIRFKRGMNPHGFVCGMFGVLAAASVTEAVVLAYHLSRREAILVSDAHIRSCQVVIDVLFAVIMVWNFLSAGLRDNVYQKMKVFGEQKEIAVPLINEDDYSLFGKISCVVLYPLFGSSWNTSKSRDDFLPELRRSVRCRHLVDTLDKKFTKRALGRDSVPGFIGTVMRILWLDVFRVAFCTVAYITCVIVRVPVLEWLIESCNTTELAASAVLFIATCIADFLISSYHVELMANLGWRLRTTLQGIIFRKMTLLSPTSRVANPPSYVVSILGGDCFQLGLSIYQIPIPLGGFLSLPILFYMLAERAGTRPTLCCAAYLVLLFLVTIPLCLLQKKFWVCQAKARDERLKLVSDLVSSVRMVKMYAWEDAYMDKVLSARDLELTPHVRLNLLDGLIDSLHSASSSVLTIILFASIAALEPQKTLTPALSFSCIYLLSLTDMITNQASLALRSRILLFIALKRVVKFCSEEEQENDQNDNSNDLQEKGRVLLDNCSFAWTKNADGAANMALRNVSLNIEPGSLIGVTGYVGSGKSSLLAAVVGDLHRTQGTLFCPGRIAYVPQLATVHNMSLRDNILYGRKMNTRYYERVIRDCQLADDLKRFPAADLTEVGEKGETLSGGQKQRVSLARAVYSDSDVYLLDDPLSALDPSVAGNVFQKVLGKSGILRNKTRIMVCNQGSFLREMDQLVLVTGNTVVAYDNLNDLLIDPSAPEALCHFSTHPAPESLRRESIADPTAEMKTSDGHLTEEESIDSSKGLFQVICAMTRYSGFWIFAALAALTCSGVALAWQLLWIKDWTDASSLGVGSSQQDAPAWVSVLTGLCCIDVLFRLLGSMFLAYGSKELARSLHSSMVKSLLYSPVTFFDANPRGRILNRFSVDLDFVDVRYYLSNKICAQYIILVVAKLAVVGTKSLIVLAVGALAGVFLGLVMRVSAKTVSTARFLEGAHMSRMLSQVTETSSCLTSIRAYGVVDRFFHHFAHLADTVMRAFLAYETCYRFVRFASAAAGFAVVLATLCLCVLFVPGGVVPTASDIGLVLSAASSIQVALSFLSITLFSNIRVLISFERCLEYAELPREHDVAPDPHHGDENGDDIEVATKWPLEGKVQFDEYSASYRPGVLPDVLRGLTFTINPGDKVGVVGRTGAGKSSLVLALIRVLRSSHGRVLIDGTDIATLPLKKLRSAITVIPQDPSLVRGTLRDNLDPTNSYSDEEIWKVLEQSHLKDLVEKDENKLQLQTGDGGSNLSVGQRQLVCLARALLRKTKLVILDEATSKMDGDTDRLIQDTLRANFVDCTLLAIAHRIHTVLNYDKILVMKRGRVLEFGNIDDLISDTRSEFRKMALHAGGLRIPST